MILNTPNNLPIPSPNQRCLPANPISRDVKARSVKLLGLLRVTGGKVLGHEATARLGNGLSC